MDTKQLNQNKDFFRKIELMEIYKKTKQGDTNILRLQWTMRTKS